MAYRLNYDPRAAQLKRSANQRTCNICGFVGPFGTFGYNPRRDALCLRCGSLERHRLLKLWLDRDAPISPRAHLLHFAPEDSIGRFIEPLCASYVTADLYRNDVSLKLDIEALGLKDEAFDVVICFHVLEHVDDIKALRELRRVLVPGGLAILAVPVVEGWEATYENSEVKSPEDRLLHFGQEGHIRRYGRDFRSLVSSIGFTLTEIVADGRECALYSLLPGERIFVGKKPCAPDRIAASHRTSGGLQPYEGRRVRPTSEFISTITASAPGRIDIAGRLDIPEYFLRFPVDLVGTSNIAINLRTRVTYVTGNVGSIVLQFGNIEERGYPYLDPSKSSLPYFWSAVRHFKGRCGSYTVTTDIPTSSGLGGSSALVVALLGVLFIDSGYTLDRPEEAMRLLMSSYLFENSLGYTSAGFQDYLAAIFGSASFWSWGIDPGSPILITNQYPICSQEDAAAYEGSILLAFTGEPHLCNRLGRTDSIVWSPKEFKDWLRVGSLGYLFAQLVRDHKWREVALIMKEERTLWLELTKSQMSRKVSALIGTAEAAGIGARFAGVASGGSVWAIGDPDDIVRLHANWNRISLDWTNATVFPVRVDSGLDTSVVPHKVAAPEAK